MTRIVVALVILALSSCAARPNANPNGPFSFYTSPQAIEFRRVAVLPFRAGDKVGRSAAVVTQSMAAALRELGYHEVVTISGDAGENLLGRDVLYQNDIAADELLRIRDQLHVDAVMLGRVEQYDSFDPISIGLSVHLVSCLDGSVAWSATGNFDGRRLDVQHDVRRWHNATLTGEHESIGGWKNILQSPGLYSRYVCDRLVATLPTRR
jgi:hypothetical protein